MQKQPAHSLKFCFFEAFSLEWARERAEESESGVDEAGVMTSKEISLKRSASKFLYFSDIFRACGLEKSV